MLIVPIYDLIVLPHSTINIPVDNLVDISGKEAKVGDKIIFLVCRDRLDYDNIGIDSFYPIGLHARVTDVNRSGYITVETEDRVLITNISVTDNTHITLDLIDKYDLEDEDEELKKKKLTKMRAELVKFVQSFQWGLMARGYILQWNSLSEIICAISNWLPENVEDKYKLLEEDSVLRRDELIEKMIYEYINIEQINNEASTAEDEETKKLYREHAIKKQMDYLQKELDELHPEDVSDIQKFEKKIEKAHMNKEAKKEALKILNRLKQESNMSQEYGILYDYLDFMTTLSWKKEKFNSIDMTEAKRVLDEDHYGLRKVKKRIMEEIAVMNLKKKQSGTILLFIGPPGTGKTSIASSIAKALNRKYIRISLGGVRDEAEIRGHRRTYIGAMPGRLMDGIAKSGVSNPVVVLDEVDKLIASAQGDPASALLEVLDPEQNNTFTDHYLNVPYDLSDVMFICTANNVQGIPEALLNRMDVIEFNGYTPVEKLHIAKEHLIPTAMKNIGLTKKDLKITDTGISRMISGYTMESGVRSLKRLVEHVTREVAVEVVENKPELITITSKNVSDFIDAREIKHDVAMKKKVPGIVTGLAWTSAGGEILFIETMFTKGSGKVVVTGQLGDVMKESSSVAISLVKNIYPELADKLKDNDLHIHVPEGATPKDGPSAGITLTTALSSLVTGKAIPNKVGMTGEVSLRGFVMPIGGLPEKLMAAERAGLKTILIPKDNEQDLKDVPEEIKEKLEIIPVETVKEVLQLLKLL